MKLKVKDISLIAILSVILFVQKEILSFIPNVSLTVFLIVLYSKKMGLYKTSIIVIIYCLLDNMLLNSFNLIFTPFLILGWLIIPLMLCTLFRKINDSFTLAILGAIFALLYCWIYLIPNVFILNINIFTYFVSDILFEIIFAISSFLSILWLYVPCSKVFDTLIK